MTSRPAAVCCRSAAMALPASSSPPISSRTLARSVARNSVDIIRVYRIVSASAVSLHGTQNASPERVTSESSDRSIPMAASAACSA